MYGYNPYSTSYQTSNSYTSYGTNQPAPSYSSQNAYYPQTSYNPPQTQYGYNTYGQNAYTQPQYATPYQSAGYSQAGSYNQSLNSSTSLSQPYNAYQAQASYNQGYASGYNNSGTYGQSPYGQSYSASYHQYQNPQSQLGYNTNAYSQNTYAQPQGSSYSYQTSYSQPQQPGWVTNNYADHNRPSSVHGYLGSDGQVYASQQAAQASYTQYGQTSQPTYNQSYSTGYNAYQQPQNQYDYNTGSYSQNAYSQPQATSYSQPQVTSSYENDGQAWLANDGNLYVSRELAIQQGGGLRQSGYNDTTHQSGGITAQQQEQTSNGALWQGNNGVFYTTQAEAIRFGGGLNANQPLSNGPLGGQWNSNTPQHGYTHQAGSSQHPKSTTEDTLTFDYLETNRANWSSVGSRDSVQLKDLNSDYVKFSCENASHAVNFKFINSTTLFTGHTVSEFDYQGKLFTTSYNAAQHHPGGEIRLSLSSFNDSVFFEYDGQRQSNILAGAGNDTIEFKGERTFTQVVDGGDGNDTIKTSAGKDTITGGAGNDALNGGRDGDTINGGAGNDVLASGAKDQKDGNTDDSLIGGAGADLFISNDIVSLEGLKYQNWAAHQTEENHTDQAILIAVGGIDTALTLASLAADLTPLAGLASIASFAGHAAVRGIFEFGAETYEPVQGGRFNNVTLVKDYNPLEGDTLVQSFKDTSYLNADFRENYQDTLDISTAGQTLMRVSYGADFFDKAKTEYAYGFGGNAYGLGTDVIKSGISNQIIETSRFLLKDSQGQIHFAAIGDALGTATTLSYLKGQIPLLVHDAQAHANLTTMIKQLEDAGQKLDAGEGLLVHSGGNNVFYEMNVSHPNHRGGGWGFGSEKGDLFVANTLQTIQMDIRPHAGPNQPTQGEASALGFGGNDTFIGHAGKNMFYGGAGNDTLYGGAGPDVLSGGEGNDVIYTDPNQARVIDGGLGFDILGLTNDTTFNAQALLNGSHTVTGIEAITLDGFGSQNVVLDTASISSLAGPDHRLHIHGDAHDTVTLQGYNVQKLGATQDDPLAAAHALEQGTSGAVPTEMFDTYGMYSIDGNYVYINDDITVNIAQYMV
ncbi:hypothetical protein [Pelagibacterium halotolerans]|uniref:hypothetical protein n=1 Tax=Pelagibacterium halotolerans TaxID=531813 RepID=UPI003851528D